MSGDNDGEEEDEKEEWRHLGSCYELKNRVCTAMPRQHKAT